MTKRILRSAVFALCMLAVITAINQGFLNEPLDDKHLLKNLMAVGVATVFFFLMEPRFMKNRGGEK